MTTLLSCNGTFNSTILRTTWGPSQDPGTPSPVCQEIAHNVLLAVLLLLLLLQDLVSQRGADLKPLLQNPRCHVYICGSSNMAQEVSRSIALLIGKKAYDACVAEGR